MATIVRAEIVPVTIAEVLTAPSPKPLHIRLPIFDKEHYQRSRRTAPPGSASLRSRPRIVTTNVAKMSAFRSTKLLSQRLEWGAYLRGSRRPISDVHAHNANFQKLPCKPCYLRRLRASSAHLLASCPCRQRVIRLLTATTKIPEIISEGKTSGTPTNLRTDQRYRSLAFRYINGQILWTETSWGDHPYGNKTIFAEVGLRPGCDLRAVCQRRK